MIQSAPKVTTITLRSGRELKLHEITFLDLQDGEEILGKSHDLWIVSDLSDPEKPTTTITNPTKTIPAMVWLLARKDGLTREEVIARKWKITLAELTAELTMKDIEAHGPTIVRCFYQPD